MQNLVATAYVFWGVSALMALLGVGLGLRSLRHLMGAKRAVGEVVAVEHDSADFPVVRFNADGDAVAGGRVVTFRSDASSSMRVGTRVPVAYRPEDPTRARIVSFGQLGAAPLVFIAFAVVFSSVGLGVYMSASSATPIPGSADHDD